MDYRAVTYVLGKIFMIIGAIMLIPIAFSLYFRESVILPFIIPAVILFLIGAGLVFIKKPQNVRVYTREGLFICGIAWIVMSLFGALPFFLSGVIPNYIDAFFEACSGFSTTGATVISDIESLPKSILFWRSFTHFIGGMGILTFMIAVVPKGKGTSMFVMKAEVPGPETDKVVSKIQTNARILYVIYCSLTLLEALILFLFTKMGLYDSLTTALSTAGTGGFSVLNDSIGGYSSPLIEWIIIVFMFLFGVNFSLIFFLFTGRLKSVIKNQELHAYILVNVLSTVVIAGNIYKIYGNLSDAVRNAAFNVNAVMSTTGFCTVDFDKWNTLCKLILVILMFFGACVGSTGGGIKIMRIMLYIKQLKVRLNKTLKPNSVSKVRINSTVVDSKVLDGVNSYLVIYIIIFASSVLLISINNFDVTTTVTSVISCLNNIGPGLSAVGPSGNFAGFSAFSKLIFCFDMLAGRLELFPILIIFSRAAYKK
ncbi:MAG: TrkH family potassium uptake protein [Clostridiales bacterium]|nr:TrkH family potassium uptake protein [Clostridiales bacterium]